MTQVNMNYPCSSTFQSSFQRGVPRLAVVAPKGFNKDPFKTSNPQIFPSLHPLSPFYRARKDVHPNPMTAGQTETFEPVKKQKLNHEVDETMIPVEEVKVPEVAVRETRDQKVKDEVLDQDGFRIPKLPKRLCGQNSESKKPKTTTTKTTTKTTTSFVVPDVILENLKSHSSDLLQNQLFKVETEAKTQSFQPVKKVKAVQQEVDNSWQNQNIEQPSQSMDHLVLNVLYERLRQEYLALYLRQNAQALFGLGQNMQ